MEQTIKEIEVNIIYSWYLGYELDKNISFYHFWKKYQRKLKTLPRAI